MPKKTNRDNLDNRRLIDKVGKDGLQNLTSADYAEATGMVGGMLSGGVGRAVELTAAPIAGELQAENEYKVYRKELGDVDRLAPRSRGVRRSLEELRSRWRGRLGEAGASVAGAVTGGLAMGALGFAGPIGWVAGLAGMGIGGFAGNSLYNRAVPRQNQNALRLATQIDQARKEGEEITQEIVFATLAANLPRRDLRKIEDKLENATDTRKIDEALADPKNQRVIARLMQKDGEADLAIRASNPMRLGTEEFTALINSGQMQAKDLLDPTGYMRRQSQRVRQERQQYVPDALASAPAMPDIRGLAQDMTTSGVTPSVGPDGQPQLLPTKPGQNRLS